MVVQEPGASQVASGNSLLRAGTHAMLSRGRAITSGQAWGRPRSVRGRNRFDAESGPDKLVIPVIRSTVTPQICPPPGEAVSRFHSVLDAIHAGKISPVSPDGGLGIQVQESNSTQPMHGLLPVMEKSPSNDILTPIDVACECARDAQESDALEQFLAVTVQQRFIEAMASGDMRFLGFQDRSLLVPGVPPEPTRDMSTAKVLRISGTSATFSTPREKQLDDEARRHAEIYNAMHLQGK